MAALVALDVAEALLQPGHVARPLQLAGVAVVAGLGEHALDDHVVGDERLGQGFPGVVAPEPRHRRRQLLVEDRLVGRAQVLVQVLVHTGDVVEPAPEELDVLGLLPEEGGEVDLIFDPARPGDVVDERHDVEGHRLLSGQERRAQADQAVAVLLVHLAPVAPVPLEVDRGRVPNAEPLRLLEEAHGHAFPVQAAGRDRHVGVAFDGVHVANGKRFPPP